MNPKQLVTDHPAETAGPLAMALAVLIADLIGVDDATTLTSLAIVFSFVPSVVTWIVNMRRKPQDAAAPHTME